MEREPGKPVGPGGGYKVGDVLSGRPVDKMETFMVRFAESIVLRLSRYQCCAEITKDGALILDPNADINSYRQLIRTLAANNDKADKLTTMLRFMIGDALLQGEDIYGEDAACVLGVELNWKSSTIGNVRYIARNIPPENRRFNLSYSMHKDVAALSKDDQAYYLNMATEIQAKDVDGHYQTEVRNRIEHDGVMSALVNVPADERDKWLDIYEKHKPHFTHLKAMVEGRMPLPHDPIKVGEWVQIKLREVRERIGGRELIKPNEVYEMLDKIIEDTVKAAAKKDIVPREV